MIPLSQLPPAALNRLLRRAVADERYWRMVLEWVRSKGEDDEEIAAVVRGLAMTIEAIATEHACRAGPRCAKRVRLGDGVRRTNENAPGR